MSTDLPPLTLAVVLLEETLVVRDTVLAEHETVCSHKQKSSAILSQGMLFHFTKSRRSTGRKAVIHQHPNCAWGLNHEELDGGHIPSHAGDGTVHFCGLWTQKRGSQGTRVINGRRNAREASWIRRELGGQVTFLILPPLTLIN